MSTTACSSRGSARSEKVEVSGRGRGIRTIDLPAVFSTAEEREMLAVITAFDLSRNELTELTNLQPLRSLMRLNASFNHLHHFDGLPLLLTQLNLAHNKLEHLDYVAQLTHLRELDVSFNRLTSLAGLTPRVPLEVLKADDNRIGRTIGLEGLQTLRVLSLSNNYIEDMDELLFLPSTPALQLMSLTGNPVTRVRRYRHTAGQLQPSLVSLDGVALTREEGRQGTSRPSSMLQRRHEEAETPVMGADTASCSRPPQQLLEGRQPSHRAQSDAARHRRSLNTSAEQRTMATQTSDEGAFAALEDSGLDPRAEVPLPAARVPAAATTTTKNASGPLGDNVPSSQRTPAARGEAAAKAGKTTSASISGGGGGGAGPCTTPPRQPPPPLQLCSQHSTERERSVLRRAAAVRPNPVVAAGQPQLSPVATPARAAVDNAEGGAQHADDVESSMVLPVKTPGSAQRTSFTTGGGGRSYVALHATPTTNASPRNPNNASGGVGGDSQRGPRFGRLLSSSASSPSPTSASLQRSAASQALDSTAAQLHDSLVAKEQLHKECHALRQRVKAMEGQLSEARRVISQQLAELSQLRLERDALRQSEADAIERLEKEKRTAKARAGHHIGEVQTLQSQYARMKAFYEAQLADTRRELSSERARLLQHRDRSYDKTVEGEGEGKYSTNAGVPTLLLPSPPSPVVPASQPLRAEQHSEAAAVAGPESAVHDGVTETASVCVTPQSSSPTGLSDDVARQLTSWLYSTINAAPSHATTTTTDARRDAAEQQQGQHSTQKDISVGDGGTNADAAAVRKALESFVASHLHLAFPPDTSTTDVVRPTPIPPTAGESPPTLQPSASMVGNIVAAEQGAAGDSTVTLLDDCAPPLPEPQQVAKNAATDAALPSPPSSAAAPLLQLPNSVMERGREGIEAVTNGEDGLSSGAAKRVVEEGATQADAEEDEVDDDDDDDTFVLSVPAEPADTIHTRSTTTTTTTTASGSASAAGLAMSTTTPAILRDQRVRAAKALLKGVEGMFEEEL
jgi:regulator of replication initiation timing